MPRKNLSYKEKENFVNDILLNQRDPNIVERNYGLSRATRYRYLQNEKKIRELSSSSGNKKRRVLTKVSNFDQRVINLIITYQSRGYPVTAEFIRQRAQEMAQEMDNNLTCSWGWWQKFRERNNVKFGTLSGECKSVDEHVIQEFKQVLIPRIICYYDDENIFNCDESGIFWRRLPTKTYFMSTHDHFGNKVSKERLTVLFCCNRAGEKLPPLIIGKSAKPRCFEAARDTLSSLDFSYKSNNSAWCTKDIFYEWLKDWHVKLEREKRKICLTLDNFSGHKVEESDFPLIKFEFLSPNSRSRTQPLDAGIIRSFKCKLVKMMFSKIFSLIDNCDPKDLKDLISLVDAITWICEGWEQVTVETIVNCWFHVGFPSDQNTIESDSSDEYELAELTEKLSLKIKDLPPLVECIEQLDACNFVTLFVEDPENYDF